MQNANQFIGQIKFKDSHSKVVVAEILESFKIKEVKERMLLTIALTSFVELAKNVNLKTLSSLENVVFKKGFLAVVAADYSIPTIFALGVAPIVTSRMLISVLRSSIPEIVERYSLDDENEVKKIERGLTFILGLINGLFVSFNIFNGGILLAIVMALGSALSFTERRLLPQQSMEGMNLVSLI